MQGRITAKDLSNEKIPVTLFVDSAMRLAIKEADMCFIGADAITSDFKVINKIGSELAADTAKHFNVPFYVVTDSWKFDPQTIFGAEEPIEKRSSREIWDKVPKGVKISNYIFEKINPKTINGVISELGVLSLQNFVKTVQTNYPWMLNKR